jgi:hypothetical protein
LLGPPSNAEHTDLNETGSIPIAGERYHCSIRTMYRLLALGARPASDAANAVGYKNKQKQIVTVYAIKEPKETTAPIIA